MFFWPNQLMRPYRTRSHILFGNTPATCPPQTSQLFGELASLVHSKFSPANLFLHIYNTVSPSSFIFQNRTTSWCGPPQGPTLGSYPIVLPQGPTSGSHLEAPPQGHTPGSHPRTTLQDPNTGSHARVLSQDPTLGSHPRVPPQGPGFWVPPQVLGPTFPLCLVAACNLSLSLFKKRCSTGVFLTVSEIFSNNSLKSIVIRNCYNLAKISAFQHSSQ